MKSLFSKPEKFTNYEATSPAARAARKWDEREGEIIVQNYNLRRLLVGMLAVVVVLTVSLVYKSLSSNVMPYIVEVDTTTGMVRNVGTVEANARYKPGESVYKYFLSRFLKNTREIPLDPVVYKENLTTSYGFLMKDAAKNVADDVEDGKANRKVRTPNGTDKYRDDTADGEWAFLPNSLDRRNIHDKQWGEKSNAIQRDFHGADNKER